MFMQAPQYFLRKDCFVCNTQDYWIVLSANRDKYMCVTHADLASIGRCLHGWRGQGGAVEHSLQFGAAADTLIASLVANGIITGDLRDGKPFSKSEHPVRESAVQILDPVAPVKLPLYCVARFFSACARIDWQLRTKKLFRTLTRIERRRLRVRAGAPVPDGTHVSRVISAFKSLRPLYPRPYLCLFDSLALLEFLASYRSFPRVVFGIVADPFQAHCWLQVGSVVLNDDLERVGRYKPILSM